MLDITINYCADIVRGTLDLLENTGLKNLVKPGMKVSVKPNLVIAAPAERGATTHSEVVEGVIRYLRDLGVGETTIIESSSVDENDTKKAFHVCGYDALSKKYDVPLYDLKHDATVDVSTAQHVFKVCRKALETDFLINVPVLKAHCQTKFTCNLKNLKGCIPDSEKRRFHTIGLHSPIAWLSKAIPTHFCVVDGICGDLSFELGGTPVIRNTLMAGADPLLLDSYGAGLIGYRADEIEYLRIAADIGVGRLFGDHTEVLELNADKKPPQPRADSGEIRKLAKYINENGACSACYAALICALRQTKPPSATKIDIGQHFRGKPGAAGCGNCNNMHDRFVPGCPPKAVDIAAFISSL